jgi:ABC-type polysaccharide/polyol phosphate transport system ATPase subunit
VSSTEIAIAAVGLGKRYRVRGLAPPTLWTRLASLGRRRPAEFWALRDATFEVPRGRTIGVIGPNGAGKSSLLGLVAGTITPTCGRVETRGRICSLLELGAGFHPDLTGRENVFLNAAILGIPRQEVRRRYERIVDFAGLAEFMDEPVRHYSSGMYVRLAFAVAAESDPEVLLVDEVLAVGDVAFQLKCLDRIRTLQRQNRTILFVSHALQTVEEFCHEAWLLHHGKIVARGEPPEVILRYIREYMGEGGPVFTQEFGTREAEILDVTFRDEAGHETGVFETGRPMHVEIRWRAHRRLERPVFGFSIKTANGLYVFGSNTQIAHVPIEAIEGEGVTRLTIAPLTLMSGQYLLSLSIHSWDHAQQYHRREDWYPFAVRNTTGALGAFFLQTHWSVTS